MGQWGAYGYAKHGVTYDKILAHYYPGTTLAPAPVDEDQACCSSRARSGSSSRRRDPFAVEDGDGAVHELAAGELRARPDARDRSSTRRSRPSSSRARSTFLAGQEPALARGTRTAARSRSVATARSSQVVNSSRSTSYVRGVVSSEMPHDWPLEAVKAQAVAARSYALAHRRGGAFDVYTDTRGQVYGGIAAETPVGDKAVAGTKRQVLLYDGKVATTFFFSSSGGRTAAVTDVFAGAKPIPYLVAVPDPYDTCSPYHTLGPGRGHGGDGRASCSASRASTDLAAGAGERPRAVGRRHRPRTATSTVAGGGRSARALGLRSTWMTRRRALAVAAGRRRRRRHAGRRSAAGSPQVKGPSRSSSASRAAPGRPGPALDARSPTARSRSTVDARRRRRSTGSPPATIKSAVLPVRRRAA